MPIICPNGCHQKENFTIELVRNEYEHGEFCGDCGEEICIFDPEAERDFQIYRLKRMTIAAAISMAMLAAAVAMSAWVLP